MDSSKRELKSTINTSTASSSSRKAGNGLKNQIVFEQVWREVEAIISAFQVTLFQQLTSDFGSSELRERYLHYLVELGAPDPLLYYVEAQYAFIQEKLRLAHTQYLHELRGRNCETMWSFLYDLRTCTLTCAVHS